MGKRSGKHRHPKQGAKKIKQEWNSPNIPSEHPLFRAYYQLQMSLSPEQFQVFWTAMKEKLPVVFRVNPNCPNHFAFLRKIQGEDFLERMLEQNQQGEGIRQKEDIQLKQKPRIEVVEWYPGRIVHQINTTKQIFKKSKILNHLHQYLQKAFDSGLIARQELVSMLPPLYLDVHSQDIILDMCAAPGSKTSQLLEMIYGQEKGLAKGCVIANDADYSRAQMLIHQINRSGTAGMAVINHPGQFLPELYSGKVNFVKQKFQFDKILCDVPCSGDGATRKLPIKWVKWHTSDGVSLHPLQLSILMKSINLLKRGGLLVYSTCSLNPIENEAVLSALLRKVRKGLEIIDIHQKFDIKGRRGAWDWKVCGTQYRVTKIVDENKVEREEKQKLLIVYQNFGVVKDYKIKESMFPPSLEQAQAMQLHHSMRILPHDQNSGGFFVALLKKHDNFEWRYDIKPKQVKGKIIEEAEQNLDDNHLQQAFVEENQPQVQHIVAKEDNGIADKKEESDGDESQGEGEGEGALELDKKEQQGLHGEERVVKKKSSRGPKYQKFEVISEQEFKNIQNFFGLEDSLRELLFVRQLQGSYKKKVILISEGVKKFLNADTDGKIKLVNMGCKVLQKGKQSFAGHECLYRLNQEGIHFFLKLMKFRKVQVSLQFFRSVLSIHSLLHDEIKDIETREKIRNMSQGSFCVYIDQIIDGMRVLDAMVGQNFKNSFHLMVGKEELGSLNLRYL